MDGSPWESTVKEVGAFWRTTYDNEKVLFPEGSSGMRGRSRDLGRRRCNGMLGRVQRAGSV